MIFHFRHLSRNDAVGFGSATVSVALSGVSPDNPSLISPSPNSEKLNSGEVFGETPKTAVETTALPNPTASFRLRARLKWLAFFLLPLCARAESTNRELARATAAIVAWLLSALWPEAPASQVDLQNHKA